MAGFFGFFDYSKPGPGIEKDAPPKPRIVVFFDILSRKFWPLLRMNILFFIFNLPAVLASIIVINFYIQNRLFNDEISDFLLKFPIAVVFMAIPLITVGPAQAGFTYVLRNYAREEHAFLWWDFKEHALKNFKQGLIVSAIDLFAMILAGFDINAYMSFKSGSLLMSVAGGFMVLALVMFMMMHMYIYPMMITFKFNLKQLYKNSLIFAIINFFPNLFILILCVVIVLLTFYFNPIVGFVMLPLITLSLIGLITNYFVYPYLKKHIMDKVIADEEMNMQSEESDNSRGEDETQQ